MLNLDDELWKKLNGGYRQPYDASILLKKLETTVDQREHDLIFNELYQELHHQGDVYLASYYSVPDLIRIAFDCQTIDFGILDLVTVIEIQRNKDNPPIPADLKDDYELAITQLGELGKLATQVEWDLSLATVALAAIAVSKGQIELAHAICILEDQCTLEELLNTY